MTNPVSGGFQFTPATGLIDTAAYPTTPINEAAARQQFMDLYWQLMNEMNKPTLSAAAYAQYNKLINGNMDVWQRGTSFTYGTAGNRYTADRWFHTLHSITSGSVSIRQNNLHFPAGSTYSLELDYTGSVGSLDSLRQAFEAINVRKLRGKKVTLSLQAKVLAGALATQATIIDGTNSDQYPNAGITQDVLTINLTDTFQTFTLSHTVQANANSLAVLLFETNKTGFAGYIYVSQVQLCVGDAALPFQPRSYAEELALCLRYYEKSYASLVYEGAGSQENMAVFRANTAGLAFGNLRFAVPKRIRPTVKLFSFGGTLNKVSGVNSAADVGTSVIAEIPNLNENGFTRISDTGNGFTAGNDYWFNWITDAEI